MFQPTVLHVYNQDNRDIMVISVTCFYAINSLIERPVENETIENARSVLTFFNRLAKNYDVIEVQHFNKVE